MWILAFIAGNTNLWVLSGHVAILSPTLQQVFLYFTPGLFLPMSGCIEGYYFTVHPPLLESCHSTWGRVPGPPEAGVALTPSLPSLRCPGQDPVGMVSNKATRVGACSIGNLYLHTNPCFSFCFCCYKARPRDRCFCLDSGRKSSDDTCLLLPDSRCFW